MPPLVNPSYTLAKKNHGFALVIALSLMAFVLVLILSLSTLVRVETGASQMALARLSAQQNALLGAYVAVGELQRTTGTDARVTVRADLFDADPDTLTADGVVNPYWLGVFRTIELGNENQKRESLRAWATDTDVAGRVSWLVSSRMDLEEAGANPAMTDVIALNGGSADNVVSLANFEDNTGNLQVVQAGKLDILNNGESVAGRFAWWVADESAKFRINAVKPNTVLNGQAFEPRWSLMAPQQSNPSIIDELSSFDVADSLQAEKLRRVTTAESLQLLDTTWMPWTEVNTDDFTISSRSLPVDVTQGRLKEDLTVYLESDLSGLSDTDYMVRGSSTDPNYVGQLRSTDFQLDPSTQELPQFGLLKSWYENGMQISGLDAGTPQAPRPHEPDQHGLHPVILRTALYFGVSYEPLANGNVLPVYLVYPKFVLWNPHNVPIAPAKYVIQVRAHTTINTQIDIGGTSYAARNITQGFNYKGNLPAPPNSNTFAHMNFAGNGSFALERDPDDGYPYFTFVIENDGFAPGETLYYTASDKHPNGDYVDTTIDGVPSDFTNHNLLINENEGPFGFFYLASGSAITPIPSNVGDPIPMTSTSDVLRTAVYFRDTLTNAPDGNKEPSLTTKLFIYKDSGQVEAIQYLDMKGADLASTNIDWEHINTEGNSEKSTGDPLSRFTDYRSLSELKLNPFLAAAHRGHGYFINPMGNALGANRPRSLARHNLAVKDYQLVDPLVSNMDTGRVHADSIPTENWFNGAPFPAGIPADTDYASVSANGYDTLGGYGLFENSSNFTQSTVYPLYDSVRSETGLLSVGFLKNVNFSQFYWQPSFPFGNSEAHTHVHRNNIKAEHGGSVYTDLSYLLNESLFDRFFVSTIPQGGAFTPRSDFVLPNTRNRLTARIDGSFPSDSSMRSSVTGFQEAAANLTVDGGFNVNSTSVDAWRMLLASFIGESVTAGDGAPSNLVVNSPVTSKLYPLLSEGTVDPSSARAWSALRSLTPSEINLLAEAIVEEVKRRGPFLSLSDFVNRRLIPDATNAEVDFLGLKGTLQAALDKVSTSGASVLNEPFYEGSLRASPADVPLNASYPEHESGMPSGLSGSRMFGVPGFLTQADLLAALSPLMTVRGDTFTIRAYGESSDQVTNSIQARAWCEVVVQRVAEPVDVSDSIIQPAGDFGRLYRVLSIRWLSEDEVI